MEEHRRAPRKRTLLDARLIFNNRFSTVDCTVRDLSATGAKIIIEHPIQLPSEVELELLRTGQSFRARVVRTDGRIHGLMFLDEAGQPLPPPDDTAASTNAGAIQAVLDEARHRIAQQAGVPPDKVRLKLEIDY